MQSVDGSSSELQDAVSS